jgi:hypothetical protein
MIEYMAIADRSWMILHSFFSKKLLGVVSLDAVAWGSFWSYYVIIFYEYFLDRGKNTIVSHHLKFLVYGVIVVLLVFFFFLLNRPQALAIPYFYLWIGLSLAIIPIGAFLVQVPKAIGKYVKTVSYFFALAALTEFVALRLDHWSFTGNHFVGWVPFLGYRIPFEEMFFFFILGSVGVISIYEFFDDDGK